VFFFLLYCSKNT